MPLAKDPAYTPRHRAGFFIAAVGSALMMASASAPSPFYPVLQREMGFSDGVMTAVFAVYAIVLLVTLLTGGSSSDHIGRRPVLSFGFALLGVSALVFDLATTPAALIGARALQGIACAFLLTTLSAAITDLEPPAKPGLAAVSNSVIPLIGLAFGALASGFVMEYASYPKEDVFLGIAVISLIFAALVWRLPETSPGLAGLLQSFRPRAGLPGGTRKPFWQCAPAIVAGWSTGGLYLSLGAPIVAVFFGINSLLIQAGVVTLLSGSGALACYFARHYSARRVMLFGSFALACGTALTLIGIATGSLTLYLLALSLAGTGFGTCFYASLRSTVPHCPPGERGELFASIFTLSYLSFGVPVVIAGFAIPHIGLYATIMSYGILITLLSALAWGWRRFGTEA